AVATARAAGALDGWFFQRYVDGPGQRPHLRVRIAGDAVAFAHLLHEAAHDARAIGDVVSIETGPYFAEAARFGGSEALPGVHASFEAASELAVSLTSGALALVDPAVPATTAFDDPGTAALATTIVAFDRLAEALGLHPGARRSCALRRREAH